LQSITGVDKLTSTAYEGSASIVIFFNFNKNMVEASDEVRNAIAGVRYKLPVEMREPVLQRIDLSAQPIMQIALSSSTLTHAEISRKAEDEFSGKFRGIDGVATVTVNGSLKRELSVLLHFAETA
jgi:HAE1 family hydrophobic/amphiphilic exporter-1